MVRPMMAKNVKLRTEIEKFVQLTDNEWGMLEPFIEIRQLKKHTLFSEVGKKSTEIGYVIEGSLRHFYLKDGEEKTTYFYFENHFVSSYISCITNQPSKLSIEALSDCELLIFPYQKMVELFEKSNSWQKFGRLIAEYIAIGLEDRMVGLLMLSPEERYLDLISGNKKKIIERIPQYYIANYLGITAVSFSRIRNRVRVAGHPTNFIGGN
jgi:CRP-like cAMP-binding protein